VLAVLLCSAGAGWAQTLPGGDRPFDVTADSVDYERERDVYVARGNVRITQQERVLTADWVSFSNTSQLGLAMGNVIVHEGGDVLRADVLHFEVDDLRGVVLDGTLTAAGNEFIIVSDEMRKVGAQVYELDDATFTTCDCPEGERLPWQISASEAELEIDGYATVKNTTFDVLGVPVFWLPWMKYPIKQERESGLLFPVIGQSARTGFDVGLPIFWAAHEQVNVTLTPHWTSDNGIKPDIEFEYVFGERSGGTFFASYVFSDDSIDPRDPATPFSDQRWAIDWQAVHELPEWIPGTGWKHKVDARLVSDNLYAFDFRELSRYRRDRFIEAKTFIEGRFGPLSRFGLSAEVLYADDVGNPDDRDRDDVLLQRAPDVRVSGAPTNLGFLNTHVSFDVRYTNFLHRDDPRDEFRTGTDREVTGLFFDTGLDGLPNGFERDARGFVVPGDGSLDDFILGPEGDALFQEGEVLADEGHRAIVNPRIQLPFRLFDIVEVIPEVGYHGTFYETDRLGSESRHLMTGLLDVRARLRKNIDLPGGGRGVHVLEPRLVYTGVLQDSQRENPLLVPRARILQERVRQLDPTSVVRDPSDRIESVNAVTLALGQRFYTIPGAGSERAPRLFADATFSAQYDFANDRIRNIFLDGTAYPTDHWRTRLIVGWDLDTSKLSETLLEAGYRDPRGNDFFFSYRSIDDIPRFFESFRFDDERFDEFEQNFAEVKQVSIRGRWAFAPRWALIGNVGYSIEESLLIQAQLGLEYVSKCRCWAVQFQIEDDRSRGIEIGLRYRLIGLGDDTVRPFERGRRSRNASLLADQ
jgi:lipopolysaccharide assembly outer membrane protein LptD (OstA)